MGAMGNGFRRRARCVVASIGPLAGCLSLISENEQPCLHVAYFVHLFFYRRRPKVPVSLSPENRHPCLHIRNSSSDGPVVMVPTSKLNTMPGCTDR